MKEILSKDWLRGGIEEYILNNIKYSFSFLH